MTKNLPSAAIVSKKTLALKALSVFLATSMGITALPPLGLAQDAKADPAAVTSESGSPSAQPTGASAGTPAPETTTGQAQPAAQAQPPEKTQPAAQAPAVPTVSPQQLLQTLQQLQQGMSSQAIAPQPPAVQAPPAQPTKSPKIIYKPGKELSVGADNEDLVPTDDVELAKKQVAAYPDSPEASFILAVALTRTSRVEEALQEVRRARKLAEPKGGPAYFDNMISTYEEMLKNYPKENRVRYGLAWAYYMKAYLLARYSRRLAQAKLAAEGKSVPQQRGPNIWETAAAMAQGKVPENTPHIQGALENADPSFVPQIKKYYELALGKLNELLAQKPNDIWAKVYRAFLKAEYTGNVEEAMVSWKACQAEAPDNPAPYFFLGEGYLKQGNLKECINNISKAIALRATGK